MGEDNVAKILFDNFISNLNLQEEMRFYIRGVLNNSRDREKFDSLLKQLKDKKIDDNGFKKELIQFIDQMEINLTSGIMYFLEKKIFSMKIRSVTEFIFLTGQLFTLFKYPRIPYRGEAKHYHKTTNTASIFRVFPKGNIDYELNEIEYFKKTKIGKKLAEIIPDNDLKWWYLTQHHGESLKDLKNNHEYWETQSSFEKKFNDENNLRNQERVILNPETKKNFYTRLLDLSRSPLIALFFACNNYNGIKTNIEDGFVYYAYGLNMTPINMRPYAHRNDRDKRYTHDCSPYTTYQDHLKDDQNQYEIDRLLEFDIDNISEYYDQAKRIVAQDGEFLRCLKNVKTHQTWRLVVSGASKESILEDLDRIYNISKETVFI